MPGKIKVKVLAGRNLPVMDRASDTTDAFVEIKFGGVTHKTDVCRKSLNPHWSSTEWYRFEVDESELQDEPLQLRLMDHDTYSANDAIGKVVISLAPLLAREANNVRGTAGPPGGAVMSGWIPVFDTMHGIRGELNVIVKVELFSDFNKYKTSSCGVQFFHCPSIPPGYRATSIHGFVEELVVNDDPEYQWIDKIRTPRASNEARQVAFIKLSNQVQRLVGLKAAELGANAVVGYQQEFDLEGEAGVVARAIGTAVSITLLPTPSQPLNIPPCTQQQLKKCLDILATDDESVTDLNQYYRTHQDELQKVLSILSPKDSSMLDEPEGDDDDDRIEQPRASIHSYTGAMSLFQDDYAHHKSLRHLSEDQTDLNRLLNRRDDDEDSDSSGPIQKIKKIKTNFFTKRFSKRKRDKRDKQDDQISIKSNTSDSSRISLAEIKNEFKKRLKKPKVRKVFTNPDDEGVGMASILARSVIHAHTSLACIAETQDSEHSVQDPAFRRTSESEPNVNMSDEDKPRKISIEKAAEIKTELEGNSVPEIHFSSLKNVSSEETVPGRVRKISESCPTSPVGARADLLKLPGDKRYYGSISSALSGESSEAFSSSEEDDESFDGKSDTEETIETTESVVNSVLNHEVNPAFIAQMDRKLSILESVHPSTSEIIHADALKEENEEDTMRRKTTIKNPAEEVHGNKPFEIATGIKITEINVPDEKIKKIESPASATDSEKCVQKHTHHIKIHNPFAHKKTSQSFSAPSSPVEKHNFVYRSSKRIKKQLAKLSKSNMIKSISHYSLLPKKKDKPQTLSQPGSSSDMQPTKVPSDTVLGSLFMSYTDLLSLDKEGFQANRRVSRSDEFGRSKVSMYIGSEPVSRASLSGPSFSHHHKDDHNHKKEKLSLKPTGLVHTAMETILIDKFDTIFLTTSPDPTQNNKQFFDDVSEKLEQHKNSGATDVGIANMGRVQATTGSTTPRVVAMTPKRLSDDFTLPPYTGHDKMRFEPTGFIHTAREAMHIDKAQAHLPGTPEPSQINPPFGGDHHKTKKDHKDFLSTVKDKVHVGLDSVFGKHKVMKSGTLVHTAMQTMLMDKAESMIPDTPEPIPVVFVDVEKPRKLFHKHTKPMKSTGLLHSALETMLIDKMQAVLPETPEPIPIHLDSAFEAKSKKVESPKESSGLIHSAVETMLIDKVQAVLPKTNEPVPIHIDSDAKKKNNSPIEESRGLVHSAIETILIDKIKGFVPDTPEPIPIHMESESDTKSENSHDISKESSGLIHSAIETMLIDKVQTVLPNTDKPIPIHFENNEKTENLTKGESDESSGLIHSAIQTMLIDKVQTVLPNTDNPIPIHIESEEKAENMTKTKDEESSGLIHSAVQTMLIDNVQTVLPDTSEPIPIHLKDHYDTKSHVEKISDILPKPEIDKKGLVHTAMETILIDKIQTVCPKSTDPVLINDSIDIKKPMELTEEKSRTIDKLAVGEDLKSPSLVGTAMQTILMDKEQSVIAKTNLETPMSSMYISSEDSKSFSFSELEETNKRKLVRQDSIHSVEESKVLQESKMSNDNITKPVLQHFHPLRSELETIPSEGSVEIEKIETSTNNASVCDNSHAACDSNRTDRDRDRSERERDRSDKDRGSPKHSRHESYGGKDLVAPAQASLNSSSIPVGIHRRSSDSDLSVTPKGGSLNTSGNMVGSGGGAILRPSMNTDNLDMLEYPFLTMTEYPPGFVVHIGGCVCARSVKLVDGGGESAARAAWWAELRTELRAHARALRCNAVIAYTDTCSICEDVCVLSASGTAAVINLDCDFNADNDVPLTLSSNKPTLDEEDLCSMAHVPYSPGTGPYRAELSPCGDCRRARVPAVLLATCAKPNRLMSYSKAVTLTAVAGRIRRAAPASEPGARDISDQLPFLEYELHKILLAKLRMQGANALFSLQTQIALGERCVMALATGTAVKLTALPQPNPPRIKATDNDKDALEIQRKLWDAFTANKIANGFDIGVVESTNGTLSDMERSGEDPPMLDLCSDKDACVLELDEAEDVETARTLTNRRVHVQAYTHALQPLKYAPPQAFAQVSRARLSLSSPGGASRAAERHVLRALESAAYKLRRLQPAALSAAFQLELPEDEIQLVVSGTAIPLMDPSKVEPITENGHAQGHNGTGDADDDIFTLDEEQLVKGIQDVSVEDKNPLAGQVPTSVSLTTLPYIASARISRRVCALRLLFVRETTAVRELGGLSGFLHTFTCEVLAIARAYTAALGGNALTSFYIRQLMLQDNAHKNQGQCLLSVGGDIVHITY